MGRGLRIGVVFLSLLLIISIALPAFAEVTFKGGPYLRIRHEYWKNWLDLANAVDSTNRDTRNFFRIKTSLWGQADFDKNTSLYAKLTNENRAHNYFEGTSGSYPDKIAGKKGYHYNINEVFVDNFYLDLKNVLDQPLDLRLGRQDLLGLYGEGFLILDGTPGDGSRSFYFNAAKASYRADDKNTFDVIYVNQPRDEEFLPVINEDKLVRAATPSQDKAIGAGALSTTDEEGLILYWKNKAAKDLALEGYYIFKHEDEEGGTGVYQAEKSKLSTLGSYVKYNFAPFTLRTQAAYQWGDYGAEDREGIGGYLFLDRDITEIKTWSPQASLGWMYLSGDDRKTGKNEGFNPVFSRGTFGLSEFYCLNLSGETGIIGYWTNMSVGRAGLYLKPTSKSKISLWYLYMRAVETVPYTVSNRYSGNGKTRGQCPQFRFDYTFNKNTTAYFLAEYFLPGNFYRNDDPGLFLRTELQLKF